MKVVCWNVNGIRAVHKKEELQRFIEKNNPDIILMQETKGKQAQFAFFDETYPEYQKFYDEAEKAGYSGVATWVKQDISCKTSTGMPGYDDNEGRLLRLDIDNFTIFNGYFPNGGKSQEAWDDKLVFYEKFLDYINALREEGRKVFFAGDVNCAHNEIDIARPKDNDGKIGFHPKERAWMDKVVEHDWVDVFRHRNPDTVIYSWWHLLSGARKRNVGWRIDYLFADKKHELLVKQISYDNDQFGSDHCPIIAEIKIE